MVMCRLEGGVLSQQDCPCWGVRDMLKGMATHSLAKKNFIFLLAVFSLPLGVGAPELMGEMGLMGIQSQAWLRERTRWEGDDLDGDQLQLASSERLSSPPKPYRVETVTVTFMINCVVFIVLDEFSSSP